MNHTADYVIGIDSSTTACKAIVWDRHGEIIAEGRSQIPLYTPHPDWHEQSAVDWWRALTAALRQISSQVNPNRLRGLCITHQRETFVPVDNNGNPLRNGIVWMDERCRPLLSSLEDNIGIDRFHKIAGKPLSVNLTIGKIAWLARYEPDVFRQTAYYLDVHAYLVFKLTGTLATGWGCADPTGLFDMGQNDWSDLLLTVIDVNREQMPRSFPPGSILGKVTTSAAKECGIQAGLPIFAGVGDGQMSGLGVNITHPGEAYLALGTSVVSGAYSEKYVTDPAFRTMYGGVPGTYILETALMGGAYTINWFNQNLARVGKDYGDEASQLPPGSQGLFLVPYWNSVLGPYWDAAASGIIIGWRGFHTPVHLYRAILEGIAFEQRLCTSKVEQAAGHEIQRLIAVGGGAHSNLWCQIFADITGKQVTRPNTREASALGAGMLAGFGVGWFADVQQAAQEMSAKNIEIFQPNPHRYEIYTRLYEDVYVHLFPALQPYIDRIPSLLGENPSGETDLNQNPDHPIL